MALAGATLDRDGEGGTERKGAERNDDVRGKPRVHTDAFRPALAIPRGEARGPHGGTVERRPNVAWGGRTVGQPPQVKCFYSVSAQRTGPIFTIATLACSPAAPLLLFVSVSTRNPEPRGTLIGQDCDDAERNAGSFAILSER
uniref:Uncharacterized protein n=1 Tax=Setaria italica TaxID=4555 RepID=K3ZAK3_SETIT